MFSPVARDLLKPQLFERMDNLMKDIPSLTDDPWKSGYLAFDNLEYKLKGIPSKKSSTFQLFLNANQFQPQHISIKIEKGFIVIHAEHDATSDMHGHTCREFTRRCKIPEDIDPATLSSTFNKNGLIVVKANTKPGNSSPSGEVTIPIEIHEPDIDEVGLQEERKSSSDLTEIEIPIPNSVS